MRYLLLIAIALQGCVAADDGSFSFKVSVTVPASITKASADGEMLSFPQPHQALLERTWPTYLEGKSAPPITITFFAGDVAAHVGHAQPGACELAAILPANCDASQITREDIAINGDGYTGPEGGYLDFAAHYYTSIGCLACGTYVVGAQ
ncbi:MAG TPA: hypothetical protein VIV40_04845 [Kofleriaceae bacterium]